MFSLNQNSNEVDHKFLNSLSMQAIYIAIPNKFVALSIICLYQSLKAINLYTKLLIQEQSTRGILINQTEYYQFIADINVQFKRVYHRLYSILKSSQLTLQSQQYDDLAELSMKSFSNSKPATESGILVKDDVFDFFTALNNAIIKHKQRQNKIDTSLSVNEVISKLTDSNLMFIDHLKFTIDEKYIGKYHLQGMSIEDVKSYIEMSLYNVPMTSDELILFKQDLFHFKHSELQIDEILDFAQNNFQSIYESRAKLTKEYVRLSDAKYFDLLCGRKMSSKFDDFNRFDDDYHSWFQNYDKLLQCSYLKQHGLTGYVNKFSSESIELKNLIQNWNEFYESKQFRKVMNNDLNKKIEEYSNKRNQV